MTNRLGRASVGIDKIRRLSIDEGGGLAIEGRLTADDTNVAKAVRAQIVGLGSNYDEQAVRFTYGADPQLDGLYVVSRCSIDHGTGSLDPNVPVRDITWSAELDPVRSQRLPKVTAHAVHAVRTNSHTVTNPAMAPAYPAATAWIGWEMDDLSSRGFTDYRATNVPTDTGNILYAAEPGDGALIIESQCPPANWYDGACLIEWRDTAGSWWPLIGRELPTIDVAAWRMSNGLVRVSLNTTGANTIKVEHWDNLGSSSGWLASKQYTINTGTSIGTIDVFPAAQVLRNAPHATVMRVIVTTSPSIYTLDMRLIRGAQQVECAITDGFNATASTTYFIAETSADVAIDFAIGGKSLGVIQTGGSTHAEWVIMTPGAYTIKGADGGLTTSGFKVLFALGIQNASGAANLGAFLDYYATWYESPRIVGR